jgi:peptidoglycan/xylan/chitin deacetylase (PgdA/CDA1 family)
MTTEELVELAGHPLVTIGAHTVDHPRLTSVSRSEALAQIEAGRRRLREVTGELPHTFAYPYGDHDLAVARIVESLGFDLAVTTEEGWVGVTDPPMRHRRMAVPNLPGDRLWRTLASSGR